jgi:hypothetical protein
MLFNTLMLVIVCVYIYIKNIYFKCKTARKVTFMPQFTFLTHLYN